MSSRVVRWRNVSSIAEIGVAVYITAHEHNTHTHTRRYSVSTVITSMELLAFSPFPTAHCPNVTTRERCSGHKNHVLDLTTRKLVPSAVRWPTPARMKPVTVSSSPITPINLVPSLMIICPRARFFWFLVLLDLGFY